MRLIYTHFTTNLLTHIAVSEITPLFTDSLPPYKRQSVVFYNPSCNLIVLGRQCGGSVRYHRGGVVPGTS